MATIPEEPEPVPTTQPESKNPDQPAATADPTSSTSPQPIAIPSSPKQSPPPIITTPPAQFERMSSIQPETSIMATTPAAIESAMKFETEEAVRKSISADARKSTQVEENNRSNAIMGAETPVVEEALEEEGILITLLILSGARSTFTINPRYLTRHGVSHSDPMQMTIYNLKECIWRDWKEDELRTKQPGSPHLIRLILLGRLLEDKSLLKDSRLNPEEPNVVHLSLRPADVGEDEMTSKGGKFSTFPGGGSRGGDRASPGCRCVIL